MAHSYNLATFLIQQIKDYNFNNDMKKEKETKVEETQKEAQEMKNEAQNVKTETQDVENVETQENPEI